MRCLKDEWTGQWRVFVLDERDAEAKKCDQLVRIHLMENVAISFGFVEQRVRVRSRTDLNDQFTYYVYGTGINAAHADGDYQQVPSLREGMTIIEWLWQNRKESHE